MDERLIEFIDHARDRGVDHATIRQVLVAAGWSEADVAEALCARDLDLPIPSPPDASAAPRAARRRESPWPRRARDAFLHVLSFGALFTWATGLIVLLFIYLDFALPDPAWRPSQARVDEALSVIRAQIAVVIVAFPVFLAAWHHLLAEVRRDPEKAKGAIRRWLAYLAMFVGAITLAGDVMTLIYVLLEGELSLRVLLKAIVLFLIAGSLVGYLALTLRSESEALR
ncbi:MAG: DUF5671 domain-containing protein [Planctomycetota bacterium]|jgi:hypothetical protein